MISYDIVSRDSPTVKFIDRIADLIHAMTSRNKAAAIKKENSPEKKVILFHSLLYTREQYFDFKNCFPGHRRILIVYGKF